MNVRMLICFVRVGHVRYTAINETLKKIRAKWFSFGIRDAFNRIY